MADTKISALSDGVTANDADTIPAARAGANVKVTPAYIRSAPAGSVYYGYNVDGTNYERWSISWASNVATWATEKGGTGTLRDMAVNVNAIMTFSSVTGGGYQLNLQAGAAGVTNSNVAVKFRANSSDVGYVGRISSLFGFFASSGAKALTIDSSTGVATVAANTATPASGSSSAVLLFGTTSGFGIYYGSGAPTVSAAQGSLYLRSDGSSTSTRMYVNNSAGSGTTWTAVTTAA